VMFASPRLEVRTILPIVFGRGEWVVQAEVSRRSRGHALNPTHINKTKSDSGKLCFQLSDSSRLIYLVYYCSDRRSLNAPSLKWGCCKEIALELRNGRSKSIKLCFLNS
jgi:hypothetical protein